MGAKPPTCPTATPIAVVSLVDRGLGAVESDPGRRRRPITHMVSSAGLPITVTAGVAFFAVSRYAGPSGLAASMSSRASSTPTGALRSMNRAIRSRCHSKSDSPRADLPRFPVRARPPDVLVVHEELHRVGPLVHAGQRHDRQPGRPDLIIRTSSGNGVRSLIRLCTRAVYPASGPPRTPAAASAGARAAPGARPDRRCPALRTASGRPGRSCPAARTARDARLASSSPADRRRGSCDLAERDTGTKSEERCSTLPSPRG